MGQTISKIVEMITHRSSSPQRSPLKQPKELMGLFLPGELGLPPEVRHQIVGYLDLKSIYALSQTCSAVRTFLKSKENAANICSILVFARLESTKTRGIFRTIENDSLLLHDLSLPLVSHEDTNPVLKSTVTQTLLEHESKVLTEWRTTLDFKLLASQAPYFQLLLERQHDNIFLYGCQVRTVSKKANQITEIRNNGHSSNFTKEFREIRARWITSEIWFYSNVIRPVMPLLVGQRSKLPELVWFFGAPAEGAMERIWEEERLEKLAKQAERARKDRWSRMRREGTPNFRRFHEEAMKQIRDRVYIS